MSYILNYAPGQTATLVFQTLNSLGARSDGYGIPSITRIISPSLTLAVGFPQSMTRLDVGLFTFQFALPTMASAVGTYIADIAYQDPDSGNPKATFFQIVVSAPFGQYSISTF
jgi:hypothetical protein